MHAAMFGLKRGYWGSLKPTRRRLTKMRLTAARFDLLYTLLDFRRPARQRFLVRKLGVTPPVVSRMLKSLRVLGYVERKRDSGDGRSWRISLTPCGRAKIRHAVRVFIKRGRVERLVERGLCPGFSRGRDRENEAFLRMELLEWLLDCVRKGFRAGGTLYYRWHPED
jgi:DNA-binding MarR family transcriptional regulator